MAVQCGPSWGHFEGIFARTLLRLMSSGNRFLFSGYFLTP